jgi:hypothetical protein
MPFLCDCLACARAPELYIRRRFMFKPRGDWTPRSGSEEASLLAQPRKRRVLLLAVAVDSDTTAS